MKSYNFLFALFSLGLFPLLTACNKEAPQQVVEKTTIPVTTEKVVSSTFNSGISVSGNIDANKTLRLGFMVAGKINYIAVNEGQTVKQGSLIASLDPVNYNIAKEMADLQVAQTDEEYNRLKIMYDRNSLSESDFAKIDFGLKQAKVQQKLHNENLSNTKLYAPISGVLLKRLAEPGEIVATGTPILVLSDISKVKVNAYIPEYQLNAIKIGQMGEVRIAAIDQKFLGKVIEVGAVADATTRAFTVKLEVNNPNLNIRPGMIAEVNFSDIEQKNILAIPATAILRTPDGQPYVYVAENQKAFKRNVSVGAVYAGKIEILSGLAVGDDLVIGGQQKLTNGSDILISQ